MSPEQPLGTVTAKALSLLTRREHSYSELRSKLINKGCSADLVDEALPKLVASGMQSDARFTESYTRSRTNKGFGPRRITLELKERGVSAEFIKQHIDMDDAKWRNNAGRQLDKKFGNRYASDLKHLATMKRFLSYRGFDSHWLKIQQSIDDE